jgi:hypothetical protein
MKKTKPRRRRKVYSALMAFVARAIATTRANVHQELHKRKKALRTNERTTRCVRRGTYTTSSTAAEDNATLPILVSSNFVSAKIRASTGNCNERGNISRKGE